MKYLSWTMDQLHQLLTCVGEKSAELWALFPENTHRLRHIKVNSLFKQLIPPSGCLWTTAPKLTHLIKKVFVECQLHSRYCSGHQGHRDPRFMERTFQFIFEPSDDQKVWEKWQAFCDYDMGPGSGPRPPREPQVKKPSLYKEWGGVYLKHVL